MDGIKMKDILIEKLTSENRSFQYNRDKETLRIENNETMKGVTLEMAGLVSRYENSNEQAIDEVVYYVEESLKVMGKQHDLKGKENQIFPVIRSTSFPLENESGQKFLVDEHTAETRIYYALDLGQSYRLIDEELVQNEGWDHQAIKEIALFNVRSLPTKEKTDSVAGNFFHFVNSNDGYDASRILIDSYLKNWNEKVKGTMCIAIPHQDVLIIADIRNETGYDILAEMGMHFFTNGNVPITALPFLYEDGELEPIFILAQNKKPN